MNINNHHIIIINMMFIITFFYNVIVFSVTTFLGVTSALLFVSHFVMPGPKAIKDDEENMPSLIEQFESLEIKKIPTKEEVDSYESLVETNAGDILLTYDLDSKTYLYYSNHRNIPVRFLEEASMQFCIDNDCRVLFTQEEVEHSNSEEEAEEEEKTNNEEPAPTESYFRWIKGFIYGNETPANETSANEAPANEAPTNETPADEEEEDQKPSVFASYKKKKENPKNKAKEIVKIMNKYKCNGTLNDYENKKKDTVETTKNEISFSNFKEMHKNKTD